MIEGTKELVIPLKIKLSALETKSQRCLGLSRCCSAGYSSGMTSSAATDLWYQSDTLQCSRALWKAKHNSLLTKKTPKNPIFSISVYGFFYWVVFRCLKVTWTQNPFPFDEGIGESFIRGSFSFPRNHKILKSMHSFCQTDRNPAILHKTNMQMFF